LILFEDPGKKGPVAEGEITRQLVALRGEPSREALDRLFELVYARLQRLAHGRLARGGSVTLDTTGLVHEAYLKFVDHDKAEMRDRQHFFAVAASAMRQIVIDHVRSRRAAKRGGGAEHAELHESRIGSGDPPVDLLELNDALDALAELDARLAQVVELKFFTGLSFAEIAAALDVTERTIQRDWRKARAFLQDAMGQSS
jgi:RNA polymerase sigma factor (TIGR02999 family)